MHVTYRSFKRFSEDRFLLTYRQSHFMCVKSDKVQDAYWMYESLESGIVNEHAPFK